MTTKLKSHALFIVVLLLPVLILPSCGNDDDDDDTFSGNTLEQSISIESVIAHLEKFESIASQNMGHRAAGSEAYNQCVDYIKSEISAETFNIREQSFPIHYFEETIPPVLERTVPSSRTYTWMRDYATFTFSGGGEVTAEIVFITPVIPPGDSANTSSDGCDPGDFKGINVNGKIAVIQRGTCAFAKKVQNAAAAGARAVIIFNEGQQGRTDVFFGSLGDTSGISVPVLAVTYQVGADLYSLVQQGYNVRMHISVSVISEWVNTANVIAETSTGTDGEVIMLGAHLDSVLAGPGINDNGSGSAAILEIGRQIHRLNYQPGKEIRIAWWAAEEQGLIGSFYYLDDLLANNVDEFNRISMYLNVDMIGSSNYVRGVLDSDQSDIFSGFNSVPAGSAMIEQTLIGYYESRGLPIVPRSMGGTDDVGFVFYGIPSGGLFTGASGKKTGLEQNLFGGTAGQPYDSCYHTPCDNTANINTDILLQNTQALAYTLQHFADSTTAFTTTQKHGIHHYTPTSTQLMPDPGDQKYHRNRRFRTKK